jgi:hypothetical protein
MRQRSGLGLARRGQQLLTSRPLAQEEPGADEPPSPKAHAGPAAAKHKGRRAAAATDVSKLPQLAPCRPLVELAAEAWIGLGTRRMAAQVPDEASLRSLPCRLCASRSAAWPSAGRRARRTWPTCTRWPSRTTRIWPWRALRGGRPLPGVRALYLARQAMLLLQPPSSLRPVQQAPALHPALLSPAGCVLQLLHIVCTTRAQVGRRAGLHLPVAVRQLCVRRHQG